MSVPAGSAGNVAQKKKENGGKDTASNDNSNNENKNPPAKSDPNNPGMTGNIIYKPQTHKGPVILLPRDVSTPPTITLEDGTVIRAVRGDKRGGVYKGENGYQWVFPNDVLGQQGATLTVGDQSQVLDNTNMSYRGTRLGELQESDNGAIGSTTTGPGGSGPFGPFTPGQVGKYGVAPAFIGQYFPNPAIIPGAASTYQYIDPIKFGETFNPYQRGELAKNFEQSKGFALDALDTEFQGLRAYAPASAQLKRDITAEDNRSNQAERTAQLDAAAPGLRQDLAQQEADARAYARGEIPNSVIDRGLEISDRSAAADIASTSGFGANSSAARKTSDLMSAKDRIALSQYGEGLLSQNANQRNQLLLAPTEYSNAGQQINVNPSISGSQLQTNLSKDANAATLIPASQGLQNSTQQSQFISGLDQQTQEFNAGNINNFALSKFNYLNSYVNSVSGAYQTDINTQVGIAQQMISAVTGAKASDAAQNAAQTQAIIGAIVAGIAIAYSDIALKDNIENYASGLEDIASLNIVSYKYKDSSIASDGGVRHVGIIAQQLRDVFPAAVSTSESGYLQINPGEIIFALVDAVKTLQNRISALEAGKV